MTKENKKILVIHTRYQNFGGEDIAVENEVKLLEKRYIVKSVYFSNKVTRIGQLFSIVLGKSNRSKKIIQKEIDNFKPDYAIVHNSWFDGSLSIFHTLRQNNIKTYLKIHNYRNICASSFLVKNHLDKNSLICQGCGFEKKNFQLFNKYYIDSYLKSFFVIRFTKKLVYTIKNLDISILVLSDFQKEKIKKLGVNPKKINVFENYLVPINVEEAVFEKPFLLYAGRISKDKGIKELIETYSKCNLKNVDLKIIGNGPLLKKMRDLNNLKGVEFVGEVSNQKVKEYIKSSLGVITCTKTFEGQPTFLCEATMLSKLSIFPKTGAISDFFVDDYDFSFCQYDYEELQYKITKLVNLSNTLDKKKLLEEQNHKYLVNKLDSNKLLNKLNQILKNSG